MPPLSDQESSFQTLTDPNFVFTPPHLIAPNMHQWFQDLESEFHQEDVKEIPRRPLLPQFSTVTLPYRQEPITFLHIPVHQEMMIAWDLTARMNNLHLTSRVEPSVQHAEETNQNQLEST